MPMPGFVVEIVSRDVVTKGGNCCLSCDNLIANGTMRAFGFAGRCASGWNYRVSDFCVPNGSSCLIKA